MPGLLRGVARTAAIAGTATAVSNRVSRRQAQRWSDRGRPLRGAAVRGAAAAAAARGRRPRRADPIEQLKELAALKDQGILTDEEFAAQKAQDPRSKPDAPQSAASSLGRQAVEAERAQRSACPRRGSRGRARPRRW